MLHHLRLARRAAALTALMILGCASVAAAQEHYPSRVVQLILPQPAGGAVDFVARTLAERLSQKLGQQVIVDNRPGANGSIAAEYVARSAPDGHTLFMAVDSNLVVNPSLYRSLQYDPYRDFAPISVIVRLYTVLVANPSLKANNIPELIALAKSKPDAINYASVGYGSLQHLGMELFNSAAGIKLTHVPYKGSSTAYTDLFGGAVSLLLIGEQTAIPYAEAGKLKILATTSQQRSKLLPQVPAIAETIPGFELKAWFGLLAPAKTPPEIRATLLRTVREIVAEPEFNKTLSTRGFEPVGSSPDEMLALMKSDTDMWAKLIRDGGFKME